MRSDTIIYEQPLNELIRTCLRLEHLFQQTAHNLQNQTVWGTRLTLEAILQILNVIDRPDLRSKLTKALTSHASSLAQLESSPSVDSQKLSQILNQLDHLIDTLHTTSGKFGQALRENEFLSTIRQHMSNPGGTCGFNTPAYHHWLEQPAQERVENLKTWLAEFDQLHAIIKLLLQLTRDSAITQQAIATHGFYQEALDSTIPYQLIRVAVPTVSRIYPEISVGRHHLSVHFFEPSLIGRASQSDRDVSFKLSCCRL